MAFTCEEKCFVKILRQGKGWGAKRICSEYRQEKWTVSSVRTVDVKTLFTFLFIFHNGFFNVFT